MAKEKFVHTWIRSLLVCVIIAMTIPLTEAGAANQPPINVVVFPLVASQGAPDSVGLAVARVLVAGMSRGDIAARIAPAGTQQADYLQTARSAGAEYYVAGFVSTIGSEVSAVEQLVATKSGVVVWQNTAAYTVPEDARASGVAMHDAIDALNAPQYVAPQTNSAPAPQAPVAPVPTVRRGPSAPQAPQTPLPIPAESYGTPPDPAVDGPRVVVVDFGGTALDAVRHYVPAAIIRTLPRYHMSGTEIDISTSDVPANGLVACAQTGADLILGGTVGSGEDGDPGMGYSVGTDLTLDVFDCKHMDAKPRVIEKQTSNGNAQTSVDIAVDQALKVLAGSHPATH
jgi:TolB-like protein